MKQTNKIPDFSAIAKELLEKRPVMVAVESQKFFKECFVKEGWTDNGFQPWQKRISPLGGNKILIGGAGANAMNLMQSIRTLHQSADRVSTGTTLSYAKYHNNGTTATVTAQSKKYWWAMYYKFAGKAIQKQRDKARGCQSGVYRTAPPKMPYGQKRKPRNTRADQKTVRRRHRQG